MFGEEQSTINAQRTTQKQSTTTIDNKHKIYEVSMDTSPSNKDYFH